MDYSKNEKKIFDDETAKNQLAKAFAKTPAEQDNGVKLPDNFKIPSANSSEKKVTVNYTVRPHVKEGIEALAVKQGFRSASAFVDLVLDLVLEQSKK